MHERKNNPKKSSATKSRELTPSGFSMSKIRHLKT